ncbi:hypothetical protein [Bacillus inaquosorum]
MEKVKTVAERLQSLLDKLGSAKADVFEQMVIGTVAELGEGN